MSTGFLRPDLVNNISYLNAWTSAVCAAATALNADRIGAHSTRRRALGELGTALRAVVRLELPGVSSQSEAFAAHMDRHEATAYAEGRKLVPHVDERAGESIRRNNVSRKVRI